MPLLLDNKWKWCYTLLKEVLCNDLVREILVLVWKVEENEIYDDTEKSIIRACELTLYNRVKFIDNQFCFLWGWPHGDNPSTSYSTGGFIFERSLNFVKRLKRFSYALFILPNLFDPYDIETHKQILFSRLVTSPRYGIDFARLKNGGTRRIILETYLYKIK